MRKLAVILISIVAAALLVAVGWVVGFQQRFLTESFAVPTVDKQITETAMTFSMLQQLDSGDIQDAKQMLGIQLDGSILTIDSLMDYTDARTRDLARKVFIRIGEYRSKHPNNYTGSLAKTDTEVDAKVASILQKAKQQQAK